MGKGGGGDPKGGSQSSKGHPHHHPKGGKSEGGGGGSSHPQSSGKGRWGHSSSSGGKGASRTPWSFVSAVDEADSLGLLELAKEIPKDWVDFKHGGLKSADKMHSTVLLKMTGDDHFQRLLRVARASKPFEMHVSDVFCSRVDRISDAEVYCIGAALSSPGLRALKDKWCEEETEEQKKVHVPYNSEGHISLAYIHARCKSEAEAFADSHRHKYQDGHRKLIVDAICYSDDKGAIRRVTLGEGGGSSTGSAAGPAPTNSQGISSASGGDFVDIDGSVLEGGGQILRMSAGYSAALLKPICIQKIRAGRSKPGLAAQHLESLRLVRDVVQGTLKNDEIGSSSVTLQPGRLEPGSFFADPKTAGAITLMVQASLVPLLLSGGACNCELKGGTDVSFSPPLNFCHHVFLEFMKKMGADCQLECVNRGFFPFGGGHVRLYTSGLVQPLKAINLSERGDVSSIEAILSTTVALPREEEEATLKALTFELKHWLPATTSVKEEPKVEIRLERASRASKIWLDVFVRTTTGCIFHGGAEPQDHPGKGGRKGSGKKGAPQNFPDMATALAKEAGTWLKKQLDTGAAVDEHLADQLILPATLAEGTSKILCGELSLHCKTAIHIAKIFLPDVRIREEKRGSLTYLEIDGVALCGKSKGQGQSQAQAAASSSTGKGRPAGEYGQSQASSSSPSAAAAAAASSERIALCSGRLSKAGDALLADLRNDLKELSDWFKVVARADVHTDSIHLTGEGSKLSEARADLAKMLAYYFGDSYER